jgi:hypothetical protein
VLGTLQIWRVLIATSLIVSINVILVYNIQNYNFTHGSVWVWNLVSDIKGGT